MFYMIGEAITAPCDIKYARTVSREAWHGKQLCSVTDKVFKDTEGVVTEIYTTARKTALTVKFQGHRQNVVVVLTGNNHQANPLVSGGPEDAQIVNTEPLSLPSLDEEHAPEAGAE